MKKHKFYFTDEAGGFNGYDRQTVWVDTSQQTLHIGRSLTIPVREIMHAEVRSLPRRPKTQYLAIDVCGPTIEGGRRTTLALIHKDFFGNTKTRLMQSFVDEMAPLIADKIAAIPSVASRDLESAQGIKQAQYVLNVSLVIAFYRKQWYSFDSPAAVVKKSLALMLLAGVVNMFGVLLVAVPFDNYRMSRNLVSAGWKRSTAIWVYLALTYPAYFWWSVQIFHWVARRG